VEARRVLKTPELTANCHFCEDTRAGVRYYTPRVRRARLLVKKVGEAYAIKYGIGTPERGALRARTLPTGGRGRARGIYISTSMYSAAQSTQPSGWMALGTI